MATIITEKEKIIQAINDLPEQSSIEDAMERLLFLRKVENGLRQAEQGQTISHKEAKERMKKWLV